MCIQIYLCVCFACFVVIFTKLALTQIALSSLSGNQGPVPQNFKGFISYPVRLQELFGCFDKTPMIFASVFFPVTCLAIYGKSNVTDKLPTEQNSHWRQNSRLSKLSTLQIKLYKSHMYHYHYYY